jgi:hypothetical protein
MTDMTAALSESRTPTTKLGQPSGAWTATEGGGAEGLIRRLGPDQLEAIDAAVKATEGRDAVDVTRDDFGAPALVGLMAATNYDIMAGRGVVVLSGLDLGRYDLEQFKRIHFGLATHLGRAVEQSGRRDRIGMVRKEPNPDRRGYLNDTELGPHTDYHEILSLASVVASDEGGVSGMVSAAAVYEAIRLERPDLLEALCEGYYYPTSPTTVTDYKVPTFSVVDGHIAIYNYVIFIAQAAEIRGEPVPPRLVEAIRFLSVVARRPELMVSFTLQPGEMLFWHNFRAMHSRTSFKNKPGHERLLLRLWLDSHEHYPLARGYRELGRILEEQHAQGWSMLVNTDESLRAVSALMRG